MPRCWTVVTVPSACLPLLMSCGDEPATDRGRPHVASESCPLKAPADWQRFIERAVEDENWVRTCSAKAHCDEGIAQLMARLQTELLPTFERCARDLADNPPIARCTTRLRRFSSAWIRQHESGSYGFLRRNGAYLAAQTGPDMPAGMMDPPSSLVAALPERANIEEAARINGWPYLTHDSALGGVRTFVTVRDSADRFEQWMLVGLDASMTLVGDGSVLSFIAVQKRDAWGQVLQRVRLHFRDYVVSNAEGSWNLLLPEEHTGKCFACHSSGMRLLIPTLGSVALSSPVAGEKEYGAGVPADYGSQRLAQLNLRLLSYGVPDWNGDIDVADHGPQLGESLGCTSCHNGLKRGVLTVSTDEDTLKRKIVDELSMRAFAPGKEVPDRAAIDLLERAKPGAPPLSRDEQTALDRARAEHRADYQAFIAERFPAWKAWTLEQPCY